MPAIMTAHVVFDALDPSGPATLSRSIVTDLLRRELGFEGVCMSDDLFMRGVSPSGGADAAEVARAGVAAVEAGCDVLLFANDGAAVDATFRALVERAERDSAFAERLREAHARTERLMRAHPPRPLRDASAIDALFADPAAAAIAARWAALPA
jgi:beta-N-acetylhexosaminidase